jgi:hypothetical protein
LAQGRAIEQVSEVDPLLSVVSLENRDLDLIDDRVRKPSVAVVAAEAGCLGLALNDIWVVEPLGHRLMFLVPGD